MPRSPTRPTYSLMARLSAGSGVAGAIVALRILGMNQFGYPLFGFIGGIAALLRPVTQMVPISVMIAPLLIIVFMIWIEFVVLLGISILTLVTLNTAPTWLPPKWVFRGPLLLSITLLFGLSLSHFFPGDQDPPVLPTPAHFIYPLFLLAVACILKRHASKPSPSKR